MRVIGKKLLGKLGKKAVKKVFKFKAKEKEVLLGGWKDS